MDRFENGANPGAGLNLAVRGVRDGGGVPGSASGEFHIEFEGAEKESFLEYIPNLSLRTYVASHRGFRITLDPAELRDLSARYQAMVHAIPRYAQEDPSLLETLSPREGFEKYVKLRTLIHLAERRLSVFFRHVVTGMTAQENVKAAIIHLDGLLVRYHSLASRLRPLLLESPDVVKSILRELHQGSFHLPSDVISATLGIPTHQGYLEEWVDWDDVRRKFGNHQYEYSAPDYDRYRDLLREMPLGDSDRVMDLGSGYGAMALYTAITTRAHVTGVEILSNRHLIGQAAAEALNIGGLTPDDLLKMSRRLKEEAGRHPFRLVSMGNSTFFFDSQGDWLKPTTIVRHTYPGDVEGMSVVFETKRP